MKTHIQNELVDYVSTCPRYADLDETDHERLYVEIKNATLQKLDHKLVELAKSGEKKTNDVQSLLLWVLEIAVDRPIKAQKIKSPGSFADIDLDYPKDKREAVFEYLYEKYGRDKVAHVATFGTLGAKAVVKAAARALGFDVKLATTISKHISNLPDIKLQDAIDASKELQIFIQKGGDEARIISVALKLEGLPNNIGVHASACVISDKPLTDYMPLMVAARKDSSEIMTQFEYYDVEALGCLKWDVLGLKTLDVLQYACQIIKERHGIEVDIDNIDVNDPKIYELLNDGHNCGIFQFESDMFLNAIQRMKPCNVDEISDITSLQRPGPMGMKLPERYVEAKFEGEKYSYNIKDKKLIEKLWEICSRSYGLLVYQEQLIRCFTELASFDEIEADNARRATGKKDAKLLASLGEEFIKRATSAGYSEEAIKDLFKQMADFSSYSFNASHAVCYSYITCMTAWLSAYYPLEFFSALLTIDAGNTDDVRRYIKAVKDRGYNVSTPDANLSDLDFVISGDSIIFGLSGIKGVGSAVSKKIMKKRPKGGYKTIGQFIIKNIDLLNSKVVESYCKAGAFKSLNVNKATVMGSVQNILDFMSTYKDHSKFHTFFDKCGIKADAYVDNCLIVRSDDEDDISYEIDSLGLYITKHPMDDYIVNDSKATDIKRIDEWDHGMDFITVGAISGIEVKKTKAKTNMCYFNLTTSTHSVKCVCFSDSYARHMDLIKEGKLVKVDAKVKEEDSGKVLMVNRISEDLRYCLCEIQKEKKVSTPFTKVKDAKDFTGKFLGVIINTQLRFLLEKG